MTTLFYETVKKGSKLIKDIPVQAPDGTSTVLPCYIINGAEEGPDICITSGVHGTEYPGIAANLIMCNYEAFLHKTMFVNPVDGKNLNEVFPGNPNGTLTEIIATTLMQLVSCSDYHIDMHSGDRQEYLNPYVFYHKNSAGRSDIDETALEMAKAYALDYIAVTEFYGESLAFSRRSAAWGWWTKRPRCCTTTVCAMCSTCWVCTRPSRGRSTTTKLCLRASIG